MLIIMTNYSHMAALRTELPNSHCRRCVYCMHVLACTCASFSAHVC